MFTILAKKKINNAERGKGTSETVTQAHASHASNCYIWIYPALVRPGMMEAVRWSGC